MTRSLVWNTKFNLTKQLWSANNMISFSLFVLSRVFLSIIISFFKHFIAYKRPSFYSTNNTLPNEPLPKTLWILKSLISTLDGSTRSLAYTVDAFFLVISNVSSWSSSSYTSSYKSSCPLGIMFVIPFFNIFLVLR